MDRKRLMIMVGAVISLGFLWLSVRGQNWSEIGVAFSQADYRWLVPVALVIMMDYFFRAVRWGEILRPAAGQRLPITMLFPVLILGFAANNVLPARAGEIWRMWGLSHRTQIRKTVALSTLVVERVFDGFTLLFLLALAGLSRPLTEDAKFIEYGFTLLFGLVLLGMLMLLFFEEWTLRLATRLMWPVPEALRKRLLDMMGRFVEGLHALRHPRALAIMIGTSLLAWGFQTLSFAGTLLAFGVNLPPTELIGVSVIMLALINLGIMIPAGPGNLGTYEAAGLLALSVAGVAIAQEKAFAIVVVSHMLQWILITAAGLAIAAHEGITLAGLSAGPQLEEG